MFWLLDEKDPDYRRKLMDWNVNHFVGRRVRYARREADGGLQQVDLARAIGISAAKLSRVERGWTALTIPELIRLAIQTRRSIDFFVKPPPMREIVETGWEPIPLPPGLGSGSGGSSIWAEMASLGG